MVRALQQGPGHGEAHYRKAVHDGVPVIGMYLLCVKGGQGDGSDGADRTDQGIALILAYRDLSFPKAVPKPTGG